MLFGPYRAALISDSVALSQAPIRNCKTMDTGPMCRTACLLTPNARWYRIA